MRDKLYDTSIYKHWFCLSLALTALTIQVKPLKAQVNNITKFYQKNTQNDYNSSLTTLNLQDVDVDNYKDGFVFESNTLLQQFEPRIAQAPNTPTLPPNQQPPTNSPIDPTFRDNQPPFTQPLPEPEPPSRLPPLEDLLPTTPGIPEASPPGDTPQTINVKRFEVKGSTVFTAEDFAQITKDYINKPITLAELYQVRSKITQLYVDKGYITSGAYIPPQKLQGDVVEIQVVEGQLEDIKVRGLRRLKSGYVRSRLAIATRKPLNRERLLSGLQQLQLNPLIQNLRAELSAGSSPGSSLLEVEVKEADTFRTQIVLDNGRSPAVGSFRRQIQVSEANLLGLGDSISALYTNTDGSNALDFNYTLPFNPRNGTLSFSYGRSDNDVIEYPFSPLDILSNSRYYELTLRQPIIQKPTQEFALGITASRRESEASFAPFDTPRIPFSDTPGADERGEIRVTALRFFQDWTQRSSREVFALRSQFSFGLDALDSTINETGPDSRFFAWRGQAQWVRLLAPDTLLLLRGDIQVADRQLVPFEQFSLGGIESVRGYRQDALLTDSGFFASAEVRIPIVRFARNNSLLQVTPFVDFGTTWGSSRATNTNALASEPNTLVSVGFGLRLQLQERLTARLDWGIPLVSISGRKDSWQENGLYFSIIANPF
ncbi:ShlB/FhaC/HecB family hemolysin secretion/activation protein [Iningainema tapete]|uniref:ShlB/FhaC/HecB family hemolysin secretion/activation protein n=1 Tax=Iningainema tapete BLCC-T55 TaxID=2748662 RepID=A0A8J7BWB5_9CYAN|nr:ShlB/FhaC/HecB family hemolysin secretion/activation protein [Iningainema tapete]MBD2771557.1 ShlB/FhaC/HecB family hemolysin secretion/activation protein [Iningainema tapete BLCC-T55]